MSMSLYTTTERLEARLQDYEIYHRTRGNKICHYIAVPLIYIVTLGLLGHISLRLEEFAGGRLAFLDAGLIGCAVVTTFFLIQDWKIALFFTPVTLGCYALGASFSLIPLWIVFVGAWGIQFLGHFYYEKKSPAFFKNIAHFLLGPMWVFVAIIRYQRLPLRHAA